MNELISQFSVDPAGRARVSGPLTLDTVAGIYRQASDAATRGRHFTQLDLDGVPRVDSSGLALLLEWQATAVRDGRTLSIRNSPPDLLSLVKLCEASGLISIEGRNHPESGQNIPSHSKQAAGS